MKYYFSSESVTKGHPDKVCDQISDALLDSLLSLDPLSRAAIETTACPSFVHVMGEVTTKAEIDWEGVVRKTIRDIGYTKPEYGFTDQTKIIITMSKQSSDIAMGVDSTESLGAGDQGMMFGYATDETWELMPLALMFARNLTENLTKAREENILSYLRPDGKAQITIEYEDGEAKRIDTVVLSTQHDPDVDLDTLRKEVKEKVILPVLPSRLLDENTKYYINPTGRFVLGGPAADTGLTGRKIIVDTYGGAAHHGGGAFSGKDATKVDRSAAYAARNIAKTIVAAKVAKKCELQLAYAIGVSEPVSLFIDTFNTGKISDEAILTWIKENFDLTPGGIIKRYELRKPQFLYSAQHGHMGGDQSWEKIDEKALASLKALIK
ncbi:MAG: methionine adenosyltransferase [Sphaerochaetaceae bacterium]|nr:methionine adenosyltransferase [Sphaerochaetaceae bacterium]